MYAPSVDGVGCEGEGGAGAEEEKGQGIWWRGRGLEVEDEGGKKGKGGTTQRVRESEK